MTKKGKVLKTNISQQPMSSVQTPGANKLKMSSQGRKEVKNAMATLPLGRTAQVRQQLIASRGGKVGATKNVPPKGMNSNKK